MELVSKPCRPQDAPSKLGLSGRVINAAVAIPYEVDLDLNKRKFDIRPRKGARAMYGSIKHLQSDSVWETIMVGWTGEIGAVKRCEPTNSPKPNNDSGREHNVTLPKISISQSEMRTFEDELQSMPGQKGRILPVWMLAPTDEGGNGYTPDTIDLNSSMTSTPQPPGSMMDKIRLSELSSAETADRQSRWRKYADEQLWPILHYKLWHEVTDGRQEKVWWRDYVAFNNAYAERIASIYRPGDIIIVHDFHLMLLPELLRQRFSGAFVTFFLHSPFPSSEIFRCLPKRKEVLNGLLGANLVGFQSPAYVNHFISSCTRVLGYDTSTGSVEAFGVHVAVEAVPIGIDVMQVQQHLRRPGVQTSMKIIRDNLRGKLIIVGRDRLDEVRGVVQKLQAFLRFLEEYPDWREQVVLIQITNPSVHDTTQLERDVSEIVNTINGTYGTFDYAPVHHYHKHIEEDEYYALLTVADVGLITSVRDGMNVTSLEYVVAQEENQGPVLISEFTGTAGSLEQAIQVNPWDASGVAAALNHALSMTRQERVERHKQLFAHTVSHNVQAWSHKLLSRLLANLDMHEQAQQTPALSRSLILQRYKQARQRLMLFDYDGTLTPIVREPSAAIPTDRMLRSLKKLAADPVNQVWIISGRDKGFLEEWLGGIEELGLSAEHGSFIRFPGTQDWVNLTSELDMSWQKDVIRIFQFFTERTQGSFIETKAVAITWHYRKADPDYGAFQAKECQAHLESTIVTQYPVEILSGKANLEVRPRNINKGEIVRSLLERLAPHARPDFVLCAGDDKTDEDMFAMLRKCATQGDIQLDACFSVTIGAASKPTKALWHLLEPKDLISALELLAGLAKDESTDRRA
ncbi:threalose-6-phosphate phosphatase [Savitreella phatthalungensis]